MNKIYRAVPIAVLMLAITACSNETSSVPEPTVISDSESFVSAPVNPSENAASMPLRY